MYVQEESDSSCKISCEIHFLQNVPLKQFQSSKSLTKIPPRKGFSLLLYVQWVGGLWGDWAVVLDDVFVTMSNSEGVYRYARSDHSIFWGDFFSFKNLLQ